MSCKICHCVSIPDNDLCPECFCNSRPFAKLVVGIEENSDGTFTTDFGHAVEFDSSGKPTVIIDGQRLSWDVYVND